MVFGRAEGGLIVMSHEQLIQQGKLQDSLDNIQDKIRSDSSNIDYRIFLFQLLAVLGSWERAEKQLDVIAKLDDGTLAMVHAYRAAIQCERAREDVFTGKADPVFMGKPEEWQALMLQALKLSIEGKVQAAQDLREQALELASTLGGAVNGDSFEWISDADSRLGPMLEVFVEGRYMWVPFTNISRIEIEEPEDLRDMVWIPGHIQWQTEGESFVLIPTRYPFSAKQEDALALSRKTEWEEKGDNTYFGYGQRLLVTDQDDYPLLDLRELALEDYSSDEEVG